MTIMCAFQKINIPVPIIKDIVVLIYSLGPFIPDR